MPVAKAAHNWERAADEWYVEPKRVTEQLLRYESFDGHTHDPCCGGGNIPSVLFEAGLMVTGSDLRVRNGQDPRWFAGCWDFMSPDGLGALGARNIVFNPPYYRGGLMEACVSKAVSLAGGKVCVFVPLRFLGSERRANGLYAQIPPDRAYIITPRPSCPPGEFLAAGGKAEGDTKDYAWLVWDERKGRTELLWMT